MSRTYYARACKRCSLTHERACKRCSLTHERAIVFGASEAEHRKALMHAIEFHPIRVVDYLLSRASAIVYSSSAGPLVVGLDDALLDDVLVDAEVRRPK